MLAACHQSALISHRGHESASVTSGRAAAERGEARTTLLTPVPCFATSFDVQGRAWIIIYFTSWHGANGSVSVSPLTVGAQLWSCGGASLEGALPVTRAINTSPNEFHQRSSSIALHL